MADKAEKTSNGDTVVVPMWGIESAQDDAVLETHSLGPCTGIAIYEPVSRTGYLAHLPNPDLGDFDDLEGQLIKQFSGTPNSFEGMKAWLAGTKGYGNEAIFEERRQWVVETLKLMGIPEESIHQHWTGPEHVAASMRLNCATGTCEIFYKDLPHAEG